MHMWACAHAHAGVHIHPKALDNEADLKVLVPGFAKIADIRLEDDRKIAAAIDVVRDGLSCRNM